jgi:hypothetical protein
MNALLTPLQDISKAMGLPSPGPLVSFLPTLPELPALIMPPSAPHAPSMPASPAFPNVPSSATAVPRNESSGSPASGGVTAGDSGSADDSRPAGSPATGQKQSAAPSQGRGDSEIGLRALAFAKEKIGVRESPPGSNRGPEVDVFTGGRAEPWCAHFVSWCVERTGTSPFGHVPSVASLRSWAEQKGCYLGAEGHRPRPGDIFTMARHDSTGKLVGGHTGFVAGVSSDGSSIETVEGNLGDAVKAGSRSLASLDGFIRL